MSETRKNALETAPVVSKRELADKVPLCCASLRACTVAGSGTITTAASHYSRLIQNWKLNIVS